LAITGIIGIADVEEEDTFGMQNPQNPLSTMYDSSTAGPASAGCGHFFTYIHHRNKARTHLPKRMKQKRPRDAAVRTGR
jgi:hypothetical protein